MQIVIRLVVKVNRPFEVLAVGIFWVVVLLLESEVYFVRPGQPVFLELQKVLGLGRFAFQDVSDLRTSDVQQEVSIVGCVVELLLAQRSRLPIRGLELFLLCMLDLADTLAVLFPKVGQ